MKRDYKTWDSFRTLINLTINCTKSLCMWLYSTATSKCTNNSSKYSIVLKIHKKQYFLTFWFFIIHKSVFLNTLSVMKLNILLNTVSISPAVCVYVSICMLSYLSIFSIVWCKRAYITFYCVLNNNKWKKEIFVFYIKYIYMNLVATKSCKCKFCEGYHT